MILILYFRYVSRDYQIDRLIVTRESLLGKILVDIQICKVDVTDIDSISDHCVTKTDSKKKTPKIICNCDCREFNKHEYELDILQLNWDYLYL